MRKAQYALIWVMNNTQTMTKIDILVIFTAMELKKKWRETELAWVCVLRV
jgi:hypothetical protein